MPLNLYQDVILTADVHDLGLRAGDVGTLIEFHNVAGHTEGYSVEFFDMTGRTIAVATLPAHFFRAPTSSDRPSVRVPQASV